MQVEVEIKLEPGRNEPKVIILTGEMTAAISDLARRLAAQTVCHFVAITLGTLPVAWACHWADNVPGGIWGYFGMFAIAYVVIWLVLTTAIRKKVRQVNQKLQGRS